MNLRKLFLLVGLAILGAGISPVAWSVDVARVNDRVISDMDLRAVLNMSGYNEGQRESMMKDSATRRQILNSLIDQEVLIGEAMKEKLDQDSEFKEAIQAFKKQYLSNRVVQKNLANKLTDTAVKKYYESHQSRYSTDQVHAMHILVSDEQRAQELLKMAKAPDADFQALAEKHSKDPSAKNNRGDLGFFGHDRMVPEFTEAAFSADDGQVVGPIKTSYGYHVIKVIDRKMGKSLSLSDVQYRVRSDLYQAVRQDYVGKLRQQAKVNVQDKVIDKL